MLEHRAEAIMFYREFIRLAGNRPELQRSVAQANRALAGL
jgi:hypothetical protein